MTRRRSRTFKGGGRQHLSEQDDVGSHVPTTIKTSWDVVIHAQFAQLVSRAAIKTTRPPNVPVQFDYVSRTRLLMEIVDVLRHQSEIIKPILPFCDRLMRGIRFQQRQPLATKIKPFPNR